MAPGLEGPDLLGVLERRDRSWLTRWIMVPDQMIEERDPIAMALLAKYDLPMPNMRLSEADVKDLLGYLGSESRKVRMQRARERRSPGIALASLTLSHAPAGSSAGAHSGHGHSGHASSGGAPSGDAVAIMNAWIREAHPGAAVNAGYMTLVNVSPADETLVQLESPAFDKVELHEMAMVGGLMKMRELTEVVVPAGGQARFEPGGRHLMLKGPRRHLTEGETVDLTLTFRSGKRQTVSVRVTAQ